MISVDNTIIKNFFLCLDIFISDISHNMSISDMDIVWSKQQC